MHKEPHLSAWARREAGRTAHEQAIIIEILTIIIVKITIIMMVIVMITIS